MPELPEVETIKNELMPHIIGRQVTDATLFWERIVRKSSVADFLSHLIGQRITGLSRRGKYLFFSLNGGEVLVMHMKMTGSLLIDPIDDRFTRAILHLDNGTRLHFWDPRKFGAMWLVEDKNTVASKLGPEPLEAGFNTEVLAQRLLNRKAPIKAILLDQNFIAGIGNMYADEALFAARIHPLRVGGSLSRDEIERLYNAIKQVLTSAIGNKGASVRNYIRPDGKSGTAHFEFKVAHGVGKNCPNCGTPIKRIKVRNRGTYFCPRCQPV